MIRATANADGGITLSASINGPAVYLDNWALIELAKKDPARRRRFVTAVDAGAEVVFSVTNAAELSGPKGASAEAVKSFLNDIGPHWYPARLNPMALVELEIKREDPAAVCLDGDFFKSYVADRMRSLSGKPVSLSDDFFSLGPIIDRVGPQRTSIAAGSRKFDETLKEKMTRASQMCKRHPALLDKKFPWIPFDSTRPACFVFFNLLRIMVLESNSLTKNDALDLCHAVAGCAYANFTTLDTTWKRRIGMLPKPNWLAAVYSREELDRMVGDIEVAVAKPGQRKFLILNESVRKKLTGTTAPCRMLEIAP